MKYAVIGTGGISAYYGARLAKHGHEVHFVARSDYETLKRDGLHVESVKGDIHLDKVSVFAGSAGVPEADVILVGIKTTGNDSLPGILKPMAGPGTLVVLIQNGLGMEEKLSEALPGTAIAGATAFICSSRTAPGRISHTAYGELTVAPYAAYGTQPEASTMSMIEALARDLEDAGVPCTVMDSLPLVRWKKLVWNIPYNGMSVARDCKTDVLTFDPELRKEIIGLMNEVIGAAEACGVHIDPSFADRMIAMTESMAPYYPSMYLDYAAGREMELDTMYRSPIAAAAGHGFDMVLTRNLLGILEKK